MPYYYGYGFGIDPLYLLVVLVCTVLGLAAQNYINSTYKTWSKVRSDGDTGATVARRMLDASGCNAVGIKGVAGELTDHYNPQDNNLYLSDSNRSGGSVKVSVTQKPEKLLIRVSDTGCGVPEEYQQSIFQPFFRVDKSRSREYGGVGLGLSLVWEIANLHGGCVRVEESSKKGTTIAVELPVQG